MVLTGRSRSLRVALLLVVAGTASFCALAPPGWHGPVTDHFDGKHFYSIEPITIGLWDWVKRVATKHRGPWRKFTPAVPAPCPRDRVPEGDVRVTFINHATVLLQMDGVNILTDPTWAERSVPIVGERRRRPPGLSLDDLPPIDAVVICHDHHDHMDLPTLRRLAARDAPTVFVGLGNARLLKRQRVAPVVELDWWQTAPVAPGVWVTAVPSRHHSGRGLFNKDATLWCGFVVRGASGSVYFAGDTGWGSHFGLIGRRLGPMRLALLPIGGANPAWYMSGQHLAPADAVRAHAVLRAATSVPIHYGTFPQSDDAELEPARKLREALATAPEPKPRFVILDNGESLDVPRADAR